MRLLRALELGSSFQISLERNRLDVAPSVPDTDTGLFPCYVAGVEYPKCVSTFTLISTCSGEGAVVQA
jgi:hypothetical protein